MEEVKAASKNVYEWLRKIHPQHWTRSHFTGRCHTDVLLNNICEVFNRQIVDARDKPILSALEYIREYLMKRIVNVQRVIDRSTGVLTPTATKLFQKIKSSAEGYKVIWNSGTKYQVNGPWNDQQVVDISEKVCSCRKWELTGILCKHGVATFWYRQQNGVPKNWVHSCYYLDTWKQVYSFKIEPISGRQMWAKSSCPTILTPPNHKTQVGRPKKKRRKTKAELSQPIVKGTKLKRVGTSVTCAKCHRMGHNSRTCKGQGGEGEGGLGEGGRGPAHP